MTNPFTFDWDAELLPDERDRILDKIADNVVRRGLTEPVAWLLEVHRPVMHVASQFGITLSPVLAALFDGGPQQMQKYTKLMSDRKNIDILLAIIDQKSTEQHLAARQ